MKDFDTLSTESRELDLYIDNNQRLYKQKEYILLNLARKIKRGKYDKRLAPKLWRYLTDAAAQAYTKDFGGAGNGSFGSFTPAMRQETAEYMAEEYYEEAKELAATL